MKFHPLADIFPLLSPIELMALADDIAERGLRESIVMYEGAILDGRNRYKACIAAAVEPTYREFGGDDPLALVISVNLRRRHLDTGQRSMVAAAIENQKRGGDRTGQDANLHLEGPAPISRAVAAEMLNVSPRSVADASAVRSSGTPELRAAAEQGEISISAAAAVADLPIEEQKAIVTAGPEAVTKAAKKIREKSVDAAASRLALLRERAKQNGLRLGKYGAGYTTSQDGVESIFACLDSVEGHLDFIEGKRAMQLSTACGTTIPGMNNSTAWLAAHPGATLDDFERAALPPPPTGVCAVDPPPAPEAPEAVDISTEHSAEPDEDADVADNPAALAALFASIEPALRAMSADDCKRSTTKHPWQWRWVPLLIMQQQGA
jgi:hypothetical protein